MVGRPTPRRGSTRSLSNRLNTSDHVSSAATRKPAASACRGEERRVRHARWERGCRRGRSPACRTKASPDGQALRRLERARLAAAKARRSLRPRRGRRAPRAWRSRPSAPGAARRPDTIRASRIPARAARVRSRLRKTCVSAKICVSPAARSFFIANSGEVCSQASRGAPSGPTRPARSPCRWVSLPGEAWRAAGSTSTKPLASNQRAPPAAIRARASSRGRRAA